MLNIIEQEILTYHKYKYCKIFTSIAFKLNYHANKGSNANNVGIFTFMNMVILKLSLVEQKNSCITLQPAVVIVELTFMNIGFYGIAEYRLSWCLGCKWCKSCYTFQ